MTNTAAAPLEQRLRAYHIKIMNEAADALAKARVALEESRDLIEGRHRDLPYCPGKGCAFVSALQSIGAALEAMNG